MDEFLLVTGIKVKNQEQAKEPANCSIRDKLLTYVRSRPRTATALDDRRPAEPPRESHDVGRLPGAVSSGRKSHTRSFSVYIRGAQNTGHSLIGTGENIRCGSPWAPCSIHVGVAT